LVKKGLTLPGLRERQLQALPQGVVVVAKQPLAFKQGLEPLGELALKNPRQIDDQLVQLRQLGQALLQLLAGRRQGRGRLRGWLVRGGWLLQGTAGQERCQSSPGPGPFGA